MNVRKFGSNIWITLLFSCSALIKPVSLTAQEIQNESLQSFLGDSFFLSQKLWQDTGKAINPGIVIAKEGHIVAFHGGDDRYRLSEDGGNIWFAEQAMGGDVSGGNAVLDESTGDIIYLVAGTEGQGRIMRSSDQGQTWKQENVSILPDGFGLYPDMLGPNQPGISLQFGGLKGRLIMPGTIRGPTGSDSLQWRPYHYGTSVYSDDHGVTWKTGKPFPVMGNKGAALAEIHDGNILYNAREYLSRGNRFMAWSPDGGDLWLNAYRDTVLPDGPRGSSYGCPGGMIRLSVDGYDILVYSNTDTDAGNIPAEPGDINTDGREKITVWVSFDGGKTWPLKRLVSEGSAGGSVLASGRAGTATEGKIYLVYEGGSGSEEGVHFAAFNLTWILDGKDVNDYLGEEYALWTIYDGSKLLTEYEEWTVETSGTPPASGSCYEVMDDPEIPGNKLIKMEDLTDDWKEALQLMWGINQTKGVTVVFRSKPTPGIIDLQTSSKEKKLMYASPRNGTYFDALLVEETAAKSGEYAFKLNQTPGFSSPWTDYGWTIYRLTLWEDSLNVYINEDTIPHFSANVAAKNDNFLQFGNNSKAPFGAFFDWMAVYYNGACAPGEGDVLPDYLTGLESFLLSVEVSPEGAGEVTGSGEYHTGQTATVSAVPNTGYEFVNWTLDGEAVSNENTYAFSMPGEDVVIAANFKEASASQAGKGPAEDMPGIFPNPATDRIMIRARLGTHIIIYNQAGVMVSERSMNENTEELDVKNYPAGMYIFKFETRESISHVRLIKN